MSTLTDSLARIGWTTGELARRLGVADNTVRHWNSGHRSPPPVVLEWLDCVCAGLESAGDMPPGWRGGAPLGRRPIVDNRSGEM